MKLSSLAIVIVLVSLPAAAQLERQPTQFDDEPEAAAPAKARLTKAPELLEGADPVYPDAARDEGRGGEVVLRLTLDAAGQVARVDLVRGAGADLDWAALGAATNFRFSPAEVNGRPAPVALEYRTVFQLDDVIEEVPLEEVDDEWGDAESSNPGETPAGPRNLVGIVREAALKNPLEGVEVTVEGDPGPNGEPAVERTTFTGEDGRFSFRGLPAGQYQISLGYAGYEAQFVDDEVSAGKRTELVVYLTPLETNQFETVIRERRARKEVAKISLSREEVRRVPGTFGDPLRVIENLPGLARAPFAGGALIVRGANPQDSGVYFDGVAIPLLYHFGGLKSVVNPEFLEDINFYPGGFGAYYGRATAGIVDVTSRRMNMSSFRGYADVSLLDSGFFFGGPVKIGQLPTITFAAAARRSYIDAFIPLALDVLVGPQGQSVVAAPVYWDYQFKLEVSPLPGQHFSLFTFGSDDDLKVVARGTGADDGFNLGFKTTWHRLVGRWESRLPGGIRHFMQPFVGADIGDVDIGSEQGISAAINLANYTWGLRDELRWTPSDFFEAAVGLDYQGSTFGIDIDFPIPAEIGSFPRIIPRIAGQNQSISSGGVTNSAALYAEAQLRVLPKVRVIPGVRAEATVITLRENELPDGTRIDGGVVELYNIDPRLTVRWEVLQDTTLKAAFGVYRQPPTGQQVAPQTGNPALLQPRALQYIGGVEQRLTRYLNLDLQLYYTARDLLVQSTSEVVNRGGGKVDPVFFNNGGQGRTVGLEVLLRHELSRHFFGWIAYTLSRSEIDINENRDRWVLTNFDQTHILTVVGQMNLPYSFTLGGRFRLVSGNPGSRPLGAIQDLDTSSYGQLSTPAQVVRLPAFHQLDVRLDRKWVFDTFSMTTYLDLLNVYNQQNAEGYQNDYRFRQREPISGLPILPVFGANGEF
jgi:TonB family protein